MCKPDCEYSAAPLSIEGGCSVSAKAPRSVLIAASVSSGSLVSSATVFELECNELLERCWIWTKDILRRRDLE